MNLINNVIDKLNYLGDSSTSYLLAHALWSACDHRKPAGPSILEMSSRLDSQCRKLAMKLLVITSEVDYSFDDQAKALEWLKSSQYWEYIADKTGYLNEP